jgi:RluA family pseudouridine synthase
VAKPNYIELTREHRIPILYEDRSIIAIDKPAGWMLVPVSWQKTNWNLQAALISSIEVGHYWARSRNIKFFKYIHRLDAETSGILLFAKSQGALNTYSDVFETRQIEKVYLAVTDQKPAQEKWTCRLGLTPDPKRIGRIVVDPEGKPAETEFRVVGSAGGRYLIEARPFTGRTHQIRVHLAESGCPIVGDELYGKAGEAMALRSVGLAWRDPFTRKPIFVRAPVEPFLKAGCFDLSYRVVFQTQAPPRPPRRDHQPGDSAKGQGGSGAARPGPGKSG